MDFTTLTKFITKHAVDEETGVLTITFRDEADENTIGELVLEDLRARAFFESMVRIQEARWPNGVTRQGHKTITDLNLDKATTEFT